MKADMLRRCSEFKKASAAVSDGLGRNPEVSIKKLLLYEQLLIETGDIDWHGAKEANESQ